MVVLVVIVVDVVVRIDGEMVRFVAKTSMGRGYHGRQEIQGKTIGELPRKLRR